MPDVTIPESSKAYSDKIKLAPGGFFSGSLISIQTTATGVWSLTPVKNRMLSAIRVTSKDFTTSMEIASVSYLQSEMSSKRGINFQVLKEW